MNWYAVSKHLHYTQEIIKTFLVPLLSSLIMGIIVFLTYSGLNFLIDINLISTLCSILIGSIAYFILLALLRCFSAEELKEMPLGTKMARLLKPLLK